MMLMMVFDYGLSRFALALIMDVCWFGLAYSLKLMMDAGIVVCCYYHWWSWGIFEEDVGCFQLGQISQSTIPVDVDDPTGTSKLAWHRWFDVDDYVFLLGQFGTAVVRNCTWQAYISCFADRFWLHSLAQQRRAMVVAHLGVFTLPTVVLAATVILISPLFRILDLGLSWHFRSLRQLSPPEKMGHMLVGIERIIPGSVVILSIGAECPCRSFFVSGDVFHCTEVLLLGR